MKLPLNTSHLNWFARGGFPPGEIGLLLGLMLCKDRGTWSVRIIVAGL